MFKEKFTYTITNESTTKTVSSGERPMTDDEVRDLQDRIAKERATDKQRWDKVWEDIDRIMLEKAEEAVARMKRNR